MIALAPNDPTRLLKEEGVEWVGDAHPQIIADINCSRQLAEHKQELIQGARARYHLGILRQRQFKAANDRIERAHVDGLGRQVASFDPDVFLQLEKVRGRGWWRDRRKLNEFLRDNPMFAIRVNAGFTNGRSFAVRVDGLRQAPNSNIQHPVKPQAPSSNSERLETRRESAAATGGEA